LGLEPAVQITGVKQDGQNAGVKQDGQSTHECGVWGTTSPPLAPAKAGAQGDALWL
jgi:hypothetical protein